MKVYTRHGDGGLTSLTREKEVYKNVKDVEFKPHAVKIS